MDIKTEQGANLVVWFCSVATHRNGVSYFLFVCCCPYYITPLESQSRLFSELYAFSFVRKSNPLITSRRTSIILPSKKAKQSLVQPLTVFHLSFIMDIKTEQGANLVVWFCSVATHRNGVSYFLFVCCCPYYITPLESQSRLFSEFFPAQIDLV